MASWCCPQASSGEVQPSVYVLTSYGRMAARCPTVERSRPGVHELLPAKCQNGNGCDARAALSACSPVRRRLPKSPGEYFGRLGWSMSELDFREELVDIF